MSPNEWTIIGVFVCTQIILFVGGVVAMRGDGKLLQAQMSDVREELKKLTVVITEQAQHRLMITQMQEIVTLTGKRIDTVDRRLNKFVDAIALNVNARAMIMPHDEEDSD